MSRRRLGRRRTRGGAETQAELDMTTFLNLMVVLVPFLLITAVFSRITIVELSLPSAAGGPGVEADTFRFEVIVRGEGFELSDGKSVLAKIPKQGDAYDLPALAEYVAQLKAENPNEERASVLLEPEIEYDHLIRVMDVVRTSEERAEETDELVRVALFSDISIGDAP